MRRCLNSALIFGLLVCCTTACVPHSFPATSTLDSREATASPVLSLTPHSTHLELAGAIEVPLEAVGYLVSCSISPDGRKLACIRFPLPCGDCEWGDLYIVDLETLDARQLTYDSAVDYPFWSADSRTIGINAYEPYPNSDGLREGIWLVSMDGEEIRFLTEGHSAAWSPNGHQIVVVEETVIGGAIIRTNTRLLFEWWIRPVAKTMKCFNTEAG